MSKWYLALISVGLLLIVFSEASQNQIPMLVAGIIISAFGCITMIKKNKRKDEE